MLRLFQRNKPEPAKAKASLEDALLQADVFEAWLYETIGERSLDWKEVWQFLQANSERLERELHWTNEDKRATALDIPQTPRPFATLPSPFAFIGEASCPFCGERGTGASACTICFGAYAR